jgi:hypothetical protein
MIGFIGTSIVITTNYNSSQSMTAKDSFHSLLDYKSLLFYCNWFGTDLRISHFFSFRCPLVNTQLSGSESELLYDWQFTANQFVLARSFLRLTIRKFIFQLNTYGCSPYVTSPLARAWVCRLLGLASAVILRSESRGTHDHIILS